ncbi:hypothetical protein [Acidocella sp.]|uniref:hypothetical protein n=1 Tax=Acidocella sp. TaxID=50710 RepID=UPI00262B26EA|nr:hypothetical protein [Acidocella sp.]
MAAKTRRNLEQLEFHHMLQRRRCISMVDIESDILGKRCLDGYIDEYDVLVEVAIQESAILLMM